MIIIQDTREKMPWNFESFAECEGQVREYVDAGDYVIQGNEQLITIDRKKSVTELANNLGIRMERFRNEMERMQAYKYRYVVCEFPYEKLLMFPKGAGLPKTVLRKIRVKGKFLAKRVQQLSEEFNVEFVFCDNREDAQQKAIELFKEAINSEQTENENTDQLSTSDQ